MRRAAILLTTRSRSAARWLSWNRRALSKLVAKRFANFGLGETFRTAGKALTVTGWIDGGGSAFDSEVWMDANEARSVFDRDNYSSLLARVKPGMATNLSTRLEGNKRLPLRALPETDYYKAQTMTARPIRMLGDFLATAMSIGAVFAAMNTMYASVGARTREVGTLRVLGFRRRNILLGFLIEGAVLAFFGGCLGVLISLPMNGYATGTFGFETFSEIVFKFRITPQLAGQGLLFSVLVGIAGSILPAWRASQLPVISALKSL